MISSERLRSALSLLQLSELAVGLAECPLCARQRLFVRLANNEIAIRCSACGASAVTLSLIAVLRALPLRNMNVYELSARGALFRFLQRQALQVTGSEYFPGIISGHCRNGILCQDVQALSFADASFDLCTSTDVFEHVADEAAGFREILRVLRPQGRFIFTVPLSAAQATVERATMNVDGTISNWLPPEYHGDPIGASRQILAFRNYGSDIVSRLRTAGFASAKIVVPQFSVWKVARPVVVAFKSVQS